MAVIAVAGIAVAVTSCSSAPKPAASATPSASKTAAASLPAGYTRIGGAAQGISIAAPASWVTVNPDKETISKIASKLNTSGLSPAMISSAMSSLQKLHAVYVVDVKAAASDPRHYAPNIITYCADSGVTNVGSAGVSLLRESVAAQMAKVATHITQKDVTIGGVPGVETSYQLSSATIGTMHGSQLEVLPKPGKVCVVTLTVGSGQSVGNVLSVAAATAEFP